MSRLWRALLPAVLFTLLLVPSQAQAHSITWSRTTVHLDFRTATHAVRSETTHYRIHHSGTVVRWRTSTIRRSPHVLVRVRFPVFRTVPPAGRSSDTRRWLITWYGYTGSPMANGIMPSIGWAACGAEVPLGTRFFVAGLGTYTCGDREGFQPFRHADLYNVPAAGSGYRTVRVLN